MIIGSALGRVFSGITVDLIVNSMPVTRPIQYHYGNQKELNKWILNRNNGNLMKYPLVWYIVNPFYEDGDYKVCKTKLLILQSTDIDWFNDTRSVRSYDEIIEPTWVKVKKTIANSGYIDIIGKPYDKYLIKDEPMFADNLVRGTDNDNRTSLNGTNNISLDIVDGRIIDLEIKIKTNCI